MKNSQKPALTDKKNTPLNRRQFVAGAGAAALSFTVIKPALVKGAGANEKIKLGLIGCGGRGAWIMDLFKAHGGYEMHAVADYFQDTADKCGGTFGVDATRRFSGLSGYKRLMESGVEAVALETPPYFFPEHATAAVQAGLHVYVAKPVAVDVPGSLMIESAGNRATQAKKVFFVDYQIPTDPFNIKVVQAVHDQALGEVGHVASFGVDQGFPDPPKTESLESRLRNGVWYSDIALGGGYFGNFDVHAIDAALWAIGQRPTTASAGLEICRPNPHGDSHDVCSAVFEYENGVVHNHFGQALKNGAPSRLTCRVYGQSAYALISYWDKAYVRGGRAHGGGDVVDLYGAGARRNIATFHRHVIDGYYANDTVRRSVDGVLTTTLAREAGERHERLTLDQVLKEDRHLDVDLSGLKS